MSAQPITNPVDRAVFDAQSALTELWHTLDSIAAKFEEKDELYWRRRMALEIKTLREELKRRA